MNNHGHTNNNDDAFIMNDGHKTNDEASIMNDG